MVVRYTQEEADVRASTDISSSACSPTKKAPGSDLSLFGDVC